MLMNIYQINIYLKQAQRFYKKSYTNVGVDFEDFKDLYLSMDHTDTMKIGLL